MKKVSILLGVLAVVTFIGCSNNPVSNALNKEAVQTGSTASIEGVAQTYRQPFYYATLDKNLWFFQTNLGVSKKITSNSPGLQVTTGGNITESSGLLYNFSVSVDSFVYKTGSNYVWSRAWGILNVVDLTSYDGPGTGDGAVYALNSTGIVYRYSKSWGGFDNIGQVYSGKLIAIDVDNAGTLWAISNDKKLYKYVGTTFVLVASYSTATALLDVAANNGQVYLVGTTGPSDHVIKINLLQLSGSTIKFVETMDSYSDLSGSTTKSIKLDVDHVGILYRAETYTPTTGTVKPWAILYSKTVGAASWYNETTPTCAVSLAGKI